MYLKDNIKLGDVLWSQRGQVAVVSVRIQSGQPATVSKQLFLSCTVGKNYCPSISGRQIAVAFVRTLFEQCTKLSESCTVRNNSCHLSSGKTRGSEEGNISRGPCYSMSAVVLIGSFLNLHPSANTAKIDPPSLLDFFHSVWRERSALIVAGGGGGAKSDDHSPPSSSYSSFNLQQS
jgi:hypothetical protein